VGGNREATRFSGISIGRIEVIVFTLTGTLAAFSGVVLTSRMYTGQPAIGNGAELDAIAAVVLGGTSMAGGRGTLGGTVVGAIIIGVIGNGLNMLNVSSFLQMVVKGLVILIAVYVDILNKNNSARVSKKNAE
jgi:ribose transport system permease protein